MDWGEGGREATSARDQQFFTTANFPVSFSYHIKPQYILQMWTDINVRCVSLDVC